MKLVLFDIDGTLLSSQGAGMRAMAKAGVTLFGSQFTFDGISAAGGLDPMLFRAAATRCAVEVNQVNHERFHEQYIQILPDELASAEPAVSLLPGVQPLLERLHAMPQIVLGLLTGNYTRSTPIKLRAVGIDPSLFDIAAYGDDAPNRPAMVPVALKRYEAKYGHPPTPRDVVLVGDTPRDVEAAHANGLRCLAVATGPYTREHLCQAGTEHIVRDLSDPRPLFDLLDLPAD